MPRPSKTDINTLISSEKYLVKKSTANLAVGLVFPNYYYLGMSNLGFHSIYDILNKNPVVSPHRFFLGQYHSMETRLPLSKCRIIAFSIPFELDFLNLIAILKDNNIPLKGKDRNEKDPLIIAGGAVTSINIEPIKDFVDIFVIGEGEEIIPKIINTLNNKQKYYKEALLEEIGDLTGILVPKYLKKPKKIKRNTIKDLSNHHTRSIILTPFTEFKNKFLLELSRGCTYQCKFCSLGYTNPLRVRPLKQIMKSAEEGLRYTNHIGLIASDVSSYPYIAELCHEFKKRNALISTASLRANALSPELLKYLKISGQKSLTIAPESGSERLRSMIFKKLSETEILETVKLARQTGFKEIKLYLMYGLPAEETCDLEENIRLIEKISAIIPAIRVSFNPFVPKPNTPFQWYKVNPKNELKKKQKFFSENLKKKKNIKASFESINKSLLQAILAKGDKSLGTLLLTKTSNQIISLLHDKYTGQPHQKEENFPWDYLDIGLKKNILLERYSSQPVT